MRLKCTQTQGSYLKVETQSARFGAWGRAAASVALSAALSLAMLPAAAFATGEAERANEAVDEAETEVSRTASEYDAAIAEQDRLAAEIKSLGSKISKLEAELPAQEERSNESLVALYKLTGIDSSIMATLLSAKSITDAIAILDSYNYIINQNLRQMEHTVKMKSDLESSLSQVESDKADADNAAAQAESALASAKQAREEAKQRAAQAQAEEAAAAKKAAEDKIAAAATKKDKKKAESEAKKEETSSSNASVSNVDWSSSKKAFVSKWAPRINSYLSGSPMAGTGKTYAAAAWDYGVDPRWAPAISCVESSKGAVCFASHNAWGYGGSGFSSWSDGIYTVVRALGGSLYGGALTKAAAQTYCPPNWQHWYSTCASEMAKI